MISDGALWLIPASDSVAKLSLLGALKPNPTSSQASGQLVDSSSYNRARGGSSAATFWALSSAVAVASFLLLLPMWRGFPIHQDSSADIKNNPIQEQRFLNQVPTLYDTIDSKIVVLLLSEHPPKHP